MWEVTKTDDRIAITRKDTPGTILIRACQAGFHVEVRGEEEIITEAWASYNDLKGADAQ